MKLGYTLIFLIITLISGWLFIDKEERPLTFMATTTTRDAGLLNILIPALEKDTGLEINVVAFGTSKVLRSAMDGNADVILVHDPINEKLFMKAGYGKKRLSIMRNDFIIVGPREDPAGVANASSAVTAFENIFNARSIFVSRSDESGTHNAERRLWKAANNDPVEIDTKHYIATGSGMGSTLNVAVEKSAYVLTDRATWVTFQNKGELAILFENDPLLDNIYSLISISPDKHPHISAQKQTVILKWFKSTQFHNIIANYKAQGRPLFTPIYIAP